MFIWGFVAGVILTLIVVVLICWLGHIEDKQHKKLHPGRGAIGKPEQ